VNAEESIVEQYVLRAGVYNLKLKSSSGRIHSEVIKGFEVEIEAMFDEKTNLEALRSLMG
jgi:hypothetical protein